MADLPAPLPTYVRSARRAVEKLTAQPGFNATEALVTTVALVEQLSSQIETYARWGRTTPAAGPRTKRGKSV
jgi:hypothetical protein